MDPIKRLALNSPIFPSSLCYESERNVLKERRNALIEVLICMYFVVVLSPLCKLYKYRNIIFIHISAYIFISPAIFMPCTLLCATWSLLYVLAHTFPFLVAMAHFGVLLSLANRSSSFGRYQSPVRFHPSIPKSLS